MKNEQFFLINNKGFKIFLVLFFATTIILALADFMFNIF